MDDDNNLIELNSSSSSSSKFYKEEVKKKNNKFFTKLFSTLLLVFSTFILGIVVSFSYIFLKYKMIPNYANKSITSTSVGDNNIESTNDLIKSVIEAVRPSVVSITTLTENKSFFNIPIQYEGSGSGIIFHKTTTDIYVATNYHVIQNASKVGIGIRDNPPVPAKLVSKDPNSDLAVISVNYDDLIKEGIYDISVAKFADSSNVNVGDYVIAIGNALGEGITSTFGIISSTSTDITTKTGDLNVLQTTAAINPGNSGGALINLNGEVIGINTAKIDNTLIEGIGYTISSNIAIPIIEQMMNNTNPATLGVYVSDIHQDNSNYDEIAGGALIVDIIKNGPAHRAGLIPNDIITSLNNTPILSSKQLVEEMKKYSSSDTVKLKILRNGKVKTIKVKLYQNPNSSTSF